MSFFLTYSNIKIILECAVLLAELTPVASVSVDYTCTTHSAMVHWSAVFGADSYRATAIGDNGTELTCTSQRTNCEIPGLSCGQSYTVHVIPMSESCRNMMNTTWATFETGETQLLSHDNFSKVHLSPHNHPAESFL